jgi:hypothetical protein
MHKVLAGDIAHGASLAWQVEVPRHVQRPRDDPALFKRNFPRGSVAANQQDEDVDKQSIETADFY